MASNRAARRQAVQPERVARRVAARAPAGLKELKRLRELPDAIAAGELTLERVASVLQWFRDRLAAADEQVGALHDRVAALEQRLAGSTVADETAAPPAGPDPAGGEGDTTTS